MIRWSYLLPRLVLVTLLLAGVLLGLDAILRWGLIKAGQAALGAKVDIARVESSWRAGILSIQGIQAANPGQTDHNLFEAAEARLQLDLPKLLRGQLVVREGRVTGLRFGGDRTSSGALPKPDRAPREPSRRNVVEWLEELAHLLRDPLVDRFESVGVAQELIEKWPREYERVTAESRRLRERVQTLRAAFEQARHRPLDNLEAVRQVVVETAELRNALERLRREAGQLAWEAKQDRHRVEDARRRDLERIEEALRISQLDAQQITDYLLGPDLAPYVNSLVEWASWSKQWLDVAGDPPQAARSRGVNVVFPRQPAGPDWLIEKLALTGEARLGRQPTRFSGVLTGLTSDQVASHRPAQLVVQLDGRHPARLEVVADCRGSAPKHTLVFDCPAIALGRRPLGKADLLVLSVDEGRAHLWMGLELQGRQVAGRIIWKQDDVQLTATLGDRLGGASAARFVQTALREATYVHAQLALNGTLDAPRWKISANLGPQLAQGLEAAARQELTARKNALVARAHREVLQELTRLEQHVHDKQQELLGQLKLGEEILGELQQLAAATGVLDPLRRKLESAGVSLPNLPLPNLPLPGGALPNAAVPNVRLPGLTAPNLPVPNAPLPGGPLSRLPVEIPGMRR